MKIDEGDIDNASGWTLLTPGPWSPVFQGIAHPISNSLRVTAGAFLALVSRIGQGRGEMWEEALKSYVAQAYSLGFWQLKWPETRHHHVWMQLWLCDSSSYQLHLDLLSPCRAVWEETGHLCSDCCCQHSHSFALHINDIDYSSIVPISHLTSSFSELTSCRGHMLLFPSLTAGSPAHLSVHTLLLPSVLSTSQFPELAPGTALQASMKCKVFI